MPTINTLRVTFIADWRDPNGLASASSGQVMDLPESLARALSNALYCTITPLATGPVTLMPGASTLDGSSAPVFDRNELTVATNTVTVDPTKPDDYSLVSADVTLAWSAAPIEGTYWNHTLYHDSASQHTATIPSAWSEDRNAFITTVRLPARSGPSDQAVIKLRFWYDGTRLFVDGEPSAYSDYTATTIPGTTDDSLDGFDKGSVKSNPTTNEVFFCTNPSINAAVWRKLSGNVGTYTVATRPSSGIAVGDKCYVSDAGSLSEWIYKTAGGVLDWHPATLIPLKDVATWTNLATGSAEQTCNQALIKAGTLRVGYRLRLWFGLGKTGTTDQTDRIRVYFGSTSTATSGTSSGWDGQSKLATATRQTACFLEFAVISATTMALAGDAGGSNNSYSAATGSGDPSGTFSIPNITSSDMYVSQTARFGGSPTTDTLQTGDWRLELLAPGA